MGSADRRSIGVEQIIRDISNTAIPGCGNARDFTRSRSHPFLIDGQRIVCPQNEKYDIGQEHRRAASNVLCAVLPVREFPGRSDRRRLRQTNEQFQSISTQEHRTNSRARSSGVTLTSAATGNSTTASASSCRNACSYVHAALRPSMNTRTRADAAQATLFMGGFAQFADAIERHSVPPGGPPQQGKIECKLNSFSSVPHVPNRPARMAETGCAWPEHPLHRAQNWFDYRRGDRSIAPVSWAARSSRRWSNYRANAR